MAARYWCHMCSQAANPMIDAAEFKCSYCQSGFIEEINEEVTGGSSSLREVQNQEIDFGIADADIRRASDAILQLLQGIREGINPDQRLDQLLRNLTDNDPIRRQGTLPARKEAVENLPTVKVCEPLQCSVCLEDFEKGSEAKEMPCKHKFHMQCILPWLELHSSCPVCRYVLPPDDELKTDLLTPRTTSVGIINLSNENVERNIN